ncbi:MAG: DUF61 family protein [Candidatus Methanomethylophilaceae archaeon]|nr:DUF61 family protein [Candidatus Methanomethylophilaceae archaeon]
MEDDPRDVTKMIAGMNSSIPAAKIPLLDLAESDDPSFRTRGGSVIEIDRQEIDLLMEVCTEMEKIRLRLPITMVTDTSGEISAWRIDGAVEAKVISRILDKPLLKDDSIRIFYPDYQVLREKLPTSIVTMYLP